VYTNAAQGVRVLVPESSGGLAAVAALIALAARSRAHRAWRARQPGTLVADCLLRRDQAIGTRAAADRSAPRAPAVARAAQRGASALAAAARSRQRPRAKATITQAARAT